jgi:hypothetical protein
MRSLVPTSGCCNRLFRHHLESLKILGFDLFYKPQGSYYGVILSFCMYIYPSPYLCI